MADLASVFTAPPPPKAKDLALGMKNTLSTAAATGGVHDEARGFLLLADFVWGMKRVHNVYSLSCLVNR